MSQPSDIQRQLGDAIRLGTIASVDRAGHTCTVTLGDITTPELPWLAFRAGGTTHWSPPTIGEQCLLLAPEGDTAAAVVVLGIYSNANPAPSSAEKVDLVRYADGAEIAYDAAAHALSVKRPAGGTAAIEAPGGITITGPVKIIGDAEITGTANVSGDVTGAGVSLKGHKHLGVQSGSAQTGAPV